MTSYVISPLINFNYFSQKKTTNPKKSSQVSLVFVEHPEIFFHYSPADVTSVTEGKHAKEELFVRLLTGGFRQNKEERKNSKHTSRSHVTV